MSESGFKRHYVPNRASSGFRPKLHPRLAPQAGVDHDGGVWPSVLHMRLSTPQMNVDTGIQLQ